MLEEHEKRVREAQAEHSEIVHMFLDSGYPNLGVDTNIVEYAGVIMRITRIILSRSFI